jgi:hypothetical protein
MNFVHLLKLHSLGVALWLLAGDQTDT